MVHVAMFLLAVPFGAVVPEEAGQAVGPGCLGHILHVVLVEGPGTGIALGTHGTAEFTQIDGDVLADIAGIQITENIPDLFLIVAGRFLSFGTGMSPVGILGVADGIIRRVVAMDRNGNLFSRVVRDGHILGEARVGAIGRYAQPAGGIVASGGTNRIHKYLVPLVQDVSLFGGILPEVVAPAPAAVVELVEALHHEPVVAAIGELGGNLGPYGLDFGLDLGIELAVVGGILDVQPLVGVVHPVILIVMGVDNHLKAGVMGKAHHLVDAVHPGFVDLIIRSGADHLEPGNGNADTGEAQCLHTVERSLRGFVALPGCFVRITFLFTRPGTVVIGVEMVAHIPAQAEERGQAVLLPGCGRLRFFCRGLRNFQRGRSGARRLEGKGGLTDLISIILRHRNTHLDVIILINALAGSGYRYPTGFLHLRNKGRLNGDVVGRPFRPGGDGGLTQSNGFRCRIRRGFRCRRRFRSLAAGIQDRYQHRQGQQTMFHVSHSYHYFSEGIDSRVSTRDEDIRDFQ